MSKVLINQIRDILSEFNEGYEKRDLGYIDIFVNKLFTDDKGVRIHGTSLDETSFGLEEVKEIIKSDWEYWGDVQLLVEDATIEILSDEIAFVLIPTTLKMEFLFTTEKFKSLKNVFKDVLSTDNKDMYKVLYLNYMLANFGIGFGEKNNYNWNLRITGILKKENNKWKFHQMQFNLPSYNYPDDCFNPFWEDIDEQMKNINERFKTFSDKHSYERAQVKSLIKNLEKDINEHDNSTELSNKYFDENGLFIGIKEHFFRGLTSIKKGIQEMLEGYSDIKLNSDVAIVNKHKDISWFMTTGSFKIKLNKDELNKKVLSILEDKLECNETCKESYVKMLRYIAGLLLIEHIGDSQDIPLKIEGIVKDNKLCFLQIATGYSWIYEHRIEHLNIN